MFVRFYACCRRVRELDDVPEKPTVRRTLKLHFDDLKNFLRRHPSRPSDFQFQVHPTFRNMKVKPWHLLDTLPEITRHTSPGLLWKKLGYKTKGMVIDSKEGVNMLHSINHKYKTQSNVQMPACLVVPTSCTSPDGSKVRLIWSFPIDITVSEAMFGIPIIKALPVDYVPSPETHHDTFCGTGAKSFDFSRFDGTVPRWLIEEAFKHVWNMIDTSSYAATPSTPYECKPYSRNSLKVLFNRLKHYFIHTPFRVKPDGHVFHKHEGVPSGSYFTNIIDTLCSYAIMRYIHDIDCSSQDVTYGDDCHTTYCSCDNGTLQKRAKDLGFTLKIEEPNSHGCLTYCKVECHRGKRFIPGQSFRNILENCDQHYRSDVAVCMVLRATTRRQASAMVAEVRTPVSSRPPHWVRKMLARGQKYAHPDPVIDPVDPFDTEVILECLPGWVREIYYGGYRT
uniref:RNA-dependent RNA polymerase n=1 Tax=Praha partiti-like virus 1 TaxID=2789619 RepID=A0A7T1GW36_9VIRU|nr:RNA-dependent RNA polymerase [Praha partiti-like virus 1]